MMRRGFALLITVCLLTAGCGTRDSSAGQAIGIAQIRDVFQAYAIRPSERSSHHPGNVFLRTLNGTAPELFALNERLISVYVYASGREAEAGIRDFEEKTAAASVVAHERYVVANVLIFYVEERASIDERFAQAIEDLRLLAGRDGRAAE